jgi:hypothetical protein
MLEAMWFCLKMIGWRLQILLAIATLLLALLFFPGCAAPRPATRASLAPMGRPVSMDNICVATTSSLEGLASEKNTLNSAIISGLNETKMFGRVTGNPAELGADPGVKVNVEIIQIKKVSDQARQWAGGWAGRASLEVRVTITDLNSDKPIAHFDAHGESGASAFAGTTDEAIQRAAEQIVAQLLKLNAESS